MQPSGHLSDHELGMNYLTLTAVTVTLGVLFAAAVVPIRRGSRTEMLLLWTTVAALVAGLAAVKIGANGFFDLFFTDVMTHPVERATLHRFGAGVWMTLVPAVVTEVRARRTGLTQGTRDVSWAVGAAAVAAGVAFGPLWLLFTFATGNTIS